MLANARCGTLQSRLFEVNAPSAFPAAVEDIPDAIAACAQEELSEANDPVTLASKVGNVGLGGLVPMRRLYEGGSSGGGGCRVDSRHAFPVTLMSLLTTVRFLNNVSDIGQAADGAPLTLGYDIRDTCGSALCGAREAYTLGKLATLSRCGYDKRFPSICRTQLPINDINKQSLCSNITNLEEELSLRNVAFEPQEPPASLIVGPHVGRVQQSIIPILTVFAIPAVTPGLESVGSADSLLGDLLKSSLSASPTAVARSIVSTLQHFGWSYVAVVTDDSNYFLSAVRSGMVANIGSSEVCISVDGHVNADVDSLAADSIADLLNTRSRVQVVVLLTGQDAARNMLNRLTARGVRQFVFVGLETWISSKEFLTHPAVGALLMISRQATSSAKAQASTIARQILRDDDVVLPSLRPYWSVLFNCSMCTASELNRTTTPETESMPTTAASQGTILSPCQPIGDVCSLEQAALQPCSGMEISEMLSDVELDMLTKFFLPPVIDALSVAEETIRSVLRDSPSLVETRHHGVTLPVNLTEKHLGAALTRVTTETASMPLILSNLQPVPGSSGEVRLVEIGTFGVHGNLLSLSTSNVSGLYWGRLNGHGNAPPVSICGRRCSPGFGMTLLDGMDQCCWNCTPCAAHHVRSRGQANCMPCDVYSRANANRTRCKKLPLSYAPISSPVVTLCIILVCGGLVVTLVTFIIYIAYRSSPIIRASDFHLSLVFIVFLFCGILCQGAYILPPDGAIPCRAKPLLAYTFHVGCFASLLIKTRRMAALFSSSLRQLVTTSHAVHQVQQVRDHPCVCLLFEHLFSLQFRSFAFNLSKNKDVTVVSPLTGTPKHHPAPVLKL